MLEINPIELKPGQELVDWVPIWDAIYTKFQKILFYEDANKQLILTLNHFVQFIEGEDEQNYHNNLVLPTLAICPDAKKFLILGGGDGLVARTILQDKPDADITLVELDGEMIELFKTHPRLTDLNKNSLSQCTVYIENALHWVPRNASKIFDIVILDFPDPTSWELKRLYHKDFLADVAYLLGENGVISIQCHQDTGECIAHLVKEILGNSAVINYTMPELVGGKIVLGRKE